MIALAAGAAAPAQSYPELSRILDEIRAAPDSRASWSALDELADPGRALKALRPEVAKTPDWADGWTVLGLLADRVGDYALGVEAGKRAVELHLAAGRKNGAVDAQGQLAHRHFRFGNSEAELAARVRLRELRIAAGFDTSIIDASIKEIEGRIRQRPDPPATMREQAAQARKAGNASLEHDCLVRLCYALYLTREFAEGAECYRRVLELHSAFRCPEWQKTNDLNGAARLTLELALVTPEPKRTELLDQARKWAEAALAGHEKQEAVALAPLVWDHCALAHIAEAQGRDPEALHHHEAELRYVVKQRDGLAGEDDRALRIFNGERFHIFEDFALFLARGAPSRQPDLARALAISDQGRIGALEELLKLRGLDVPAWATRALDVDGLRKAAGSAHAAIVVFLRGSHDAGAITITGTGVGFRAIEPFAALDEAGKSFLGAVLDVSTRPADLDRAATAAFETFLAKSLPDDPAITRIIVTGAGAISSLPFGAMARPGKEPLARRHLAAHYEIAAAPSLASLAIVSDAARPSSIVSAGFNGGGALYDPALAAHYGIAALKPLQGAEKEAEAMGKALNATVLKGAAATEAAFRAAAPGASLLHVASHAIADETDGSKTALLLAPDPGKSDGILTIGDLLELRLSAQLVVLSGCRTAHGEVFTGESIGGLARAVLASGARNLVASVGPVDDQTAPKLVPALFRSIRSGAPVARAFAAAQRQMLADPRTAHPALWAPFILFGQGDLLR